MPKSLCAVFVFMLAAAAGAVEPAEAIQRIAAQEARLPSIEARIAEAKNAGLAIAYPTADFLIAKRFCLYAREDVANDRVPRALEVADDVATLLDRADREARDGVEVPRIMSGQMEIRNGAFWGTCTTRGLQEKRPVFLTGYGHGDPVVDDLPLLSDIGINVIQIEQGPEGVVLADGTVDTTPITGRLIAALDRARAHGVALNLLISPHYFPTWALEKWPALKLDPQPAGTQPFLKNSIEAIQARDIYERYLRALIPLIQGHPALHSICLSNEPVYDRHQDDPARLPLWHAHLQQQHGDIATLNNRYGTQYAAFEDVPESKLSFRERQPALYDTVRFNQARFSGWHRWMVDIIHEIAPEIPCHAKVMPLVWDRDSVFWGTDPLEFAQLSQINGNDCYFVPNDNARPWPSDWLVQGSYYDLQRSMAHAPIFNSENHLIMDRTDHHVEASHIYTGIWQGAIHGQGASATWIWGRTYDKKSDLEGLILHRAACTAAMSRSALDLMRLSREVYALQRERPEVAILWSNAAQVHDPRVTTCRSNVYEALNFCGVPIGFLHEQQIAEGALAGVKCLIVAGANAATAASIEAIRAYQAGGGTVIAYGEEALIQDEYGQKVAPITFTREISRSERGADLAVRLQRELKAAGIAPGVALQDAHGDTPYGVEWRSTQSEGRILLNLINLTRKPITLQLPEGDWQDLIARATLPRALSLPPMTPVLAQRTD